MDVKIYDNEEKRIIYMDADIVTALIAAANMPYYFPKEALKAQIILARTHLAKKIKILGGEGCCINQEADICKKCLYFLDEKDLKIMWGSDFLERWNYINSLVSETSNKIVTINGKPIMPIFHKACGGSTENSENILGYSISYLRKTYCEYCKNNLESITNIDISVDEIEEALGTRTPIISWEKGPQIKGFIENEERDTEGRIKSIKIGDKNFKGQEIIEKLGISSTKFGWKPKVITFESKGFGDGLGMCQFGAKVMAQEGKKAEEILKMYFTGVNIDILQQYEPLKPLHGRKILIDPGNGVKINEEYYGRDTLLQISFKIKELLSDLGADIYLTRESNVFCSMQMKAEQVKLLNPDFYIGINCDYEKNKQLAGTKIFHFRGDIESHLLAESIFEKLKECTKLVQRGIKIAELSLFKEIKVNALLIELGYLSNEHDKSEIESIQGIENISYAVAEGIKNFYQKK
ncbi:MAG: SpoIID/LytB domain-containing protein [Clostridiales bacterium]|nr:SpoIID/LytB domain-containing protein [Clostridiales bacterium]